MSVGGIFRYPAVGLFQERWQLGSRAPLLMYIEKIHIRGVVIVMTRVF